MNDDARGQHRSVPTILNQSTVHGWPQNCFSASGMDTPPSDEFHRASCSWFTVSTDVQSLDRITLTIRSTVVSETLFSEGNCLGSGGIVQIDDSTRCGSFSEGK